MSVVTKYYCDVCGEEDPECKAWTLAPTWVRDSSKRVSYTACDSCVKVVVRAVEDLLKFK